MDRAARCRLLGSGQVITLRAGKFWDVVPGGIVTGKPRKQMINLYKATGSIMVILYSLPVNLRRRKRKPRKRGGNRPRLQKRRTVAKCRRTANGIRWEKRKM
jgi:hypothetical protein